MPDRLERLHYHVIGDPAVDATTGGRPAATFRGPVPPGTEDVVKPFFNSDESAARYYLDHLLRQDERSAFRSIASPHRPELLPDLEVRGTRELPATGTRVVRFEQEHNAIPVFGTQAVVELNDRRELISVEARLGEVRNVTSIPNLNAEDALQRVARFARTTLSRPEPSTAGLAFFQDDEDGPIEYSWHLAWHLKHVPAVPPEVFAAGPLPGHGMGPSPRAAHPLVGYLVDAHTGAILYYYSEFPTLDMPTVCWGVDEEGNRQQFWGRIVNDRFLMSDPLRHVETVDLDLTDLEPEADLVEPVENTTADWEDTRRAAVSAHINAMRVHDFLKQVLQRNGVDDLGMTLVSIVNCTYSQYERPPVWTNAMWSHRKMWYGQVYDEEDRLVSTSRYLDIIAHELTHGVTEFTSHLVYRDAPGALNESFSDIFAILIKNWYLSPDRNDVRTWDWEIGRDFAEKGRPLRDLSDPARTGMPDHMIKYVQTAWDFGGVHANSNIHNKAAFHLLNMENEQGAKVLPPDQAAVLFYLALDRLMPLATFADARQALIDVCATYYAGNTDLRDGVITAIHKAYDFVGIDRYPPRSAIRGSQ
jgi:bacillolysin